MVCKECGYKNKYRKEEARFCVNCGASLDERKPAKRRETENPRQGRKRSRKSKRLRNEVNNSKVKLFGYGLIAVFGSLLIYFLLIQNSGKPKPIDRIALEQKRGDPFVEVKVFDLASKFACACGGCDEDPLDVCQCDYAIEERNFIRSGLQNSLSDQAIIEAMNKKYGGLKEKT